MIITNPTNPSRNSTVSRESETVSNLVRAICQLRNPQAIPDGSNRIIAKVNIVTPSRPMKGKPAYPPRVAHIAPTLARIGQETTASSLSRCDLLYADIRDLRVLELTVTPPSTQQPLEGDPQGRRQDGNRHQCKAETASKVFNSINLNVSFFPTRNPRCICQMIPEL